MTPPKHQYNITLNTEKLCLRLVDQFTSQMNRWTTPRHSNAEYELHIILEGSADVEVEDRIHHLTPGQAIVIPPGRYHYPSVTSQTFRRFSLSFVLYSNTLRNVMQTAIPESIVFTLPGSSLDACDTICLEYNNETAYRQEMISALLTALTITVFRTLQLPLKESTGKATYEDSRIPMIDVFFSTSYFENAGGEEALAHSLHLSKRQLARVLEQHYGMGFQQKLTSARMDRAAWLLRTTDKRCAEIAELVGYSSESAFYQAFRKFFHTTPDKYRRQC